MFVRQDAFDILEYAYKLGFVINVFTNGTLLNDNDFFRLKEIYPRCVYFSLYNSIPEKHDSFTQLPGSALLEHGDPLRKYSGVCLIAEARKIKEEGE